MPEGEPLFVRVNLATGRPYGATGLRRSDICFQLLFDMLTNGLIALPFLFIGRLFEALVLLYVGQNARLLAGLGEPPQSLFEGFTGSYDNACHG